MRDSENGALDLSRYLEKSGDLYDLILALATEFAAGFKATLHHDEAALREAIKHFQSNFPGYYDGLLETEPSHIKMFGFLLHSLTQLPAWDSDAHRLNSFGLSGVSISEAQIQDPVKRAEITELLEDWGNEAICFFVVFYEFHRVQRQRKAQPRISISPPPLHFRYFRAVIDYLRPFDDPRVGGTRSPYDLYMLLKTMDLFAMDTDYGSGSMGR